MLESKKLYPVTILRSLDIDSQVKLSEAGLLLCNDLAETEIGKLNRLTKISINKLRILTGDARGVIEA